MRRGMLRIAGALIVGGIAAAALAADSFEAGTEGWRATGGEISVSDAHWKLDARSLRWEFEPGAELAREADASLEDALTVPGGGIKMWLYCEEPIEGELRIQAGPWIFPVNLGFTGWRAAWVVFAQDAQAGDAVEGLKITAPNAAGTIFIDAVELGPVPWFRQGDAQAPYTNPRRANGKYWTTSHEHAQVVAPAPERGFSTEDAAAFREIERRYGEWMFGGLDDPREPVKQRLEGVEGHISWGHKTFEELGIERQGDTVSGPGAFCLQDTQKPHLAPDILQYVALPMAYDARLHDSDRARQRFLDLIDYAHDQGWAAGSLMGTAYGEYLRISGYVHAVYILRDYLREQGRLERELETLRYHINFGEIYGEPEHSGASADDLRTIFIFRLLCVLMLDDSSEKLRDMECLVRWGNAALSDAPAYGDTIKPDGTVFHHATAYASAYGNNAMLMSSIVYWLLDDTRFALSEDAGQNIKHALLTQRFMAGKYHFPTGVSGRWPFSGATMYETCAALAYMADALDDAELGAAFARLWDPTAPGLEGLYRSASARIYWANSPGALPWLLDTAARYSPEPEPQGHRSYPFAAMSFHRRRQWVASARGWSKYIWNYEASASENRYGRYSSYGMIQVFAKGTPVNREDSGYREDGWDWLRPPGATVIRVPLEDLHESKVQPRSYTEDPFVGGATLEQTNGVWAMRFADPLYDQSFGFRKSVFFVGETLVCLGSDITNVDAEHATETVLYQTALAGPSDPFPLTETRETTWLMDPVGNGYYFPRPQTVELRRHHQESMHNSARKATEGDFAVAWIDHGEAPTNGGYAYAIRPDTTGEAMAQFAETPNFEILRRDDAAHVVSFPEAGITGYVLFEGLSDLEIRPTGVSDGAVRKADGPCLVMERREGDRLVLAVSDPDLRLGAPTPQTIYDPGGEGQLRLTLNGDWEVDSAPDTVRATDDHTLEFTCRDGATYEVTLRRVD